MNSTMLSGKTALVTGTSQGIGRMTAKMLAAEGVQLCIAIDLTPITTPATSVD